MTVPRSVGCDRHDRSPFADADTSHLDADGAAAPVELQFLQSPFQILPRFEHMLRTGAFSPPSVHAQQQHALGLFEAEFFTFPAGGRRYN